MKYNKIIDRILTWDEFKKKLRKRYNHVENCIVVGIKYIHNNDFLTLDRKLGVEDSCFLNCDFLSYGYEIGKMRLLKHTLRRLFRRKERRRR